MQLINKTRTSRHKLLLLAVILLTLSACTVNQPASTPTIFTTINLPTDVSSTVNPTPVNNPFTRGTSTPIIAPSSTSPSIPPLEPSQTETLPQPSPTAILPDAWMTLPIIPTVSQTARSIYQHGIELGNDPHAFSKIGDCQSITTYFLSHFDIPGQYNLGEYSYLQETIAWYAGSFSRESLSVKGGFNAAAILSPLRSDPQQCQVNESWWLNLFYRIYCCYKICVKNNPWCSA